MQAEPPRFADGLDAVSEVKRGVKDGTKVYVLSKCGDETPIYREWGKLQEKLVFGETELDFKHFKF